jgi:hypothetical protein
VVGAVALVGCGFPRPAPLADDGGVDGAMADAGDANCFGSFARICLAALPTMPFTVSSASTVETGSPLCAAVRSGGSSYCVIAATEITIGATLRATGRRPLVLIGTESIVTTGLIDVGSHLRGAIELGAGADPVECEVGTLPSAGGGIAGGSFLGLGGSGGNGRGGLGGMAAPAVDAVTKIRGGCPAANGTSSYVGGHGGGAVYLISGGRIDLRGGINAAGEAGGGSSGGANGGWGGGAGGMIGFEAPQITADSLIVATGGGGGEGSEGVVEGRDGSEPSSTMAAHGGSGNSGLAGDGGDGSSGLAGARGLAGGSGGSSAGGGGGGGGAGLVKAPGSARLGAQVAPAATP